HTTHKLVTRSAENKIMGNRNSWSSMVADHRKHQLFNSCTALALCARHGARQGGGVTMGVTVRLMGLFRIGLLIGALILDEFRFLMLAHELLVQLPQLHLQFFE
ncbi:MAG: hypothetical protein KF751_21470, partial [Nitrospira sp.]|nr:hypothetical protein [Nitrospira sp.]